MDKDYIEVKIPILDSVDEMKAVKTFTQEQLWFVCAIAKAFEKSEQQVKKQKEVIDKVNKKCQLKKENYDYDVWLKLNSSWEILNDFAEHIKYNLHPIITEAYMCDIKNSINKIIEITKKDVVLKKDILDILKEVSE